MKKKQNQGFTLIEMLLVVAVIAVLVSIAVPRVSNATDKSAAAADAANLRAAKSAIATKLLEDRSVDPTKLTAEELGIPAFGNYNGEKFHVDNENGIITVLYGEMDINELADIADNGKPDSSNAGSATTPVGE